MRFVLHAGIHKTGSTAIQQFLTSNADRLRTRGVLYPTKFFRSYSRQHSALALALRQKDIKLVHDFFSHCREVGTRVGATVTIVSGEELSVETESSLQRLRSEILAVDPDASIEVILYYRNLYDLAISMMQQTAKKNRRLFNGPRDHRMVTRMSPTGQINRFERVFSEQSVKIGSYDTAVRADGLERNFLELAGVEWSDDLVSTPAQNMSMDLISTTFLNMLGYEYGLDNTVWRKYAKIAPKPFPMPTLRNDLVESLHSSVSRIDVSHPKLDQSRAMLTEMKMMPAERRAPIGEFLESFESLIREVRVAVDEPSDVPRATRQ